VRVLFSSTAGHGHVFPLVPLAQALRDAGHDVLWAGHPSVQSLVDPAGLASAPAGLRGQEFIDVVGALRRQAFERPPVQRAAFMFPAMFGAALTPAMAADLLSLARAWRPDLLVHEQAELASPLVGAVLGLPSVTQSFGSAIPPAILSDAGERLRSLWREYGLEVPPYAGCYMAPFLDIFPPSIRPVPVDHIAVVQPLRPVSYTGPAEPLPFAVSGPGPLIYLTLGTIPGSGDTLRRAVDAVAVPGSRVLATVGPEGDPAELGTQPPNVRVVRYAPQSQVLPHCDLVVSHAGSGTFLGALGLGLPQLCLPQAADQFRNSDACVRAGAGIALHPDRATPAAIRDAVSALLVQQTYRTRAAALQAEIEAMPSPAEVIAVLRALV
jgi:UDP:flavonoid glycosyltransferase YjiC (YdhE family)